MSANKIIDLTSLENALPQDDQNDRRDDDNMSIDSYNDGSIKADAPEDELEFDELINFFATKRRVIDILYSHIFKHNTFVTRWKGRLSRENLDLEKHRHLPVRAMCAFCESCLLDLEK